MLATLSQFGQTSESIWEFAAGVLAFMLLVALFLMAVSLIKRLIE